MQKRTYPVVDAARIFLLGLLLIGSADAVTMGQARVESYLNQPLSATIPLIGLADGQHRDLRLRLANQAAFDRLGITYEPSLADLQFAVVREGDDWVVRVTTRRPVREPFLDFPLQLSWTGGRLVRQYSLLLDPVSRPTPIRDATVTGQAPVARPASPGPATATPPAPRTVAPVSIARDTVTVRRGDTLWLVAERVRTAGITTRQMAMALLRANPEAFIDGNLNRVRAGAELRIPPLGFIQQLDPAAARAAFAAEIERWRRPAVATAPRSVERAPSRSPQAPAPEPASLSEPAATDAAPAAGEDSAATVAAPEADEEGGTAAAEQPHLRIVAEEPDAAVDPRTALEEQLLVTMEEIETTRINTREVEARLARLEAELTRMEELVALKEDQIATLQSELTARGPVGPTAPGDPSMPGAGEQATTRPAPVLSGSSAMAGAETPVTADAEALPQRTLPLLREWVERNPWLLWAALAAVAMLLALLYLYRRMLRNRMMVPLPVPDERTPSQFDERTAPTVSRADMRAAAQELRDANRRARSARAERPAMAQRTRVGETDPRVGRMLDEVSSPAGGPPPDPATPAVGVPARPTSNAPGKRPQREIETPLPAASDAEVARWAAELSDETGLPGEESRAVSELDDLDVPSLLVELDDQFAAQHRLPDPAPVAPASAPAAPTRAGDDSEDEGFIMSLDLARAYLEIGDREGARDMLAQALLDSTDTGERRQLEDMLRDLDANDRAT